MCAIPRSMWVAYESMTSSTVTSMLLAHVGADRGQRPREHVAQQRIVVVRQRCPRVRDVLNLEHGLLFHRRRGRVRRSVCSAARVGNSTLPRSAQGQNRADSDRPSRDSPQQAGFGIPRAHRDLREPNAHRDHACRRRCSTGEGPGRRRTAVTNRPSSGRRIPAPPAHEGFNSARPRGTAPLDHRDPARFSAHPARAWGGTRRRFGSSPTASRPGGPLLFSDKTERTPRRFTLGHATPVRS